jgi:broad specificity phosphatase PhoE
MKSVRIIESMAMPNDFVLVRHGQSEANIVHTADKSGDGHPDILVINERPDWQQRLSPLGIEQAKLAKRWLDENLGGRAVV